MLTNSPVTQSRGARTLFFLGTIVTVGILLYAHQVRVGTPPPGLQRSFLVLFVYEDYWATALELLLLVATVFLASRIPSTPILRQFGQHPWRAAAFTVIILSIGCLFSYRNHPLSMDEYAAYFQSRIFAAGHMTGRFPLAMADWLIPPGFQDFFLQISHLDGRVTSTYWPGHALLMAPFSFLHITWAYNAVVSALTLVIMHRIALEIFGDIEAAGLVLLLTVASPVIFGLGVSYYSMPSHLLANCIYTLLLLRPTAPRVLGAGVVGSVALVMHNPVPHTLYALPWIIWLATRPGGLRLLGMLFLGYVPVILIVGFGWFEFSNELRREGREAMAAVLSTPERIRTLLSAFSPPTRWMLLARAIEAAKIWVWAVPGLVILAFAGAIRWHKSHVVRILTSSALATLIGYLFFTQDQGHGWGDRYFHSAWLTLPLLAAAAIYTPRHATEGSRDTAPVLFGDMGTRRFITTCALLTLVFGVPWRAWQMQEFMAHDLDQSPHYLGTERQVIMMDPRHTFYGGDLIQNDPFLRDNKIRMLTHGPSADQAMMSVQFPDMHVVYQDVYGTVWSAAPAMQSPSPDR